MNSELLKIYDGRREQKERMRRLEGACIDEAKPLKIPCHTKALSTNEHAKPGSVTGEFGSCKAAKA